MSELQRSFARAQLAKLPPEAPLIFDEREEEENQNNNDDEQDHVRSASDSSASSTGTIVPSPTKHLFERPKSSKPSSSRLSPLEWTEFFDTEIYLERQVGGARFTHHAYVSSPLPSGPLLVTHHGAGSSGLSFACFAVEVRKAIPAAGVLSIDARGHGGTTIAKSTLEDDDQADTIDLSLTTLSSDLAYVVQSTQAKMSWSALPDVILIGHSLGGAVVVDLANKALLGSAVLGYAVIDVVEGSAMEALAHMETYLSNRPSKFPSLASAVEWHTRSRTIRNPLSARVSVPSLLLPAIADTAQTTPSSSTSSAFETPSTAISNPDHQTITYTWRTPLLLTQSFWPTWFQNLSTKFLSSRGAKLLLLAGTDRLDRELMIGQMQGKYQLQVFPEAGHFVHEDQPAKVAAVVAEFWRRNDRAALVLPPKVGEVRTGEGSVAKKG